MSIRTPASRAHGLGSAREGTGHFWAQRLTAVALIPLLAWFVFSIAGLAGADYETSRDFISAPFPAVLVLLLIAAGLYHLKLGIQVIIEDYVHGEAVKIALLMFNALACIAIAAICAFSVFKLAFAG